MNALSKRVMVIVLSGLFMLIGMTGCDGPGLTPTQTRKQAQVEKVSRMLEPNVIGVRAFYSGLDPFMWTEDRSHPRGIIVSALYLVGPEGKGVFGDGIIRPRMYVADRKPDGTRDWKLVQEWALTVEDAMLYRSKRESQAGWGYRLHLPWREGLELTGREIRLVVGFERKDGIVVHSSKKDYRVPRGA